MMANLAPSAVLVALVGGVVGWLLVPWAANLLLKRAYGRSCSWWWQSYRAYCAFRCAHSGSEPAATAFGEEGALGLWRDDAVRAASAGVLARERVCALASVGFKVQPSDAVRTEPEQEMRCSLAARLWQRGCCAAAGAVGGAVLACWELPFSSAAALALCLLAMEVAAVCDLQARILPLECCGIVLAAGSAFQVATAGVSGLGAGAITAGVVLVGCAATNRLFCKGGSAPVGQGDIRCMVALCLATGSGALPGIAVCYASAGIFSIAGIALRKLSAADGIPMAPFLAAWLVSGACASVFS